MRSVGLLPFATIVALLISAWQPAKGQTQLQENTPSISQIGNVFWLEISLNHADKGPVLAATLGIDSGLDTGINTSLWIETQRLQEWGVLYRSSSVVQVFDDISFSQLESIQGVQYQWDAEHALVALQIDPRLLPTQYISQTPSAAAAIQYGRGFHLNYDSLLGFSSDSRYAALLLEPVIYAPYGQFRSSFRSRYDDNIYADSTQQLKTLRLDSLFSHDFVAQRSRLIVGDFVSAADSLGTRYRMGGIQLQRAFSIAPKEITFATPRLSGLATLPSDIELFINGVRQTQFSAQPGPFELRNPPIMTGAGQAELVVTNALGEQQVQSLSFYVDPQILRQGLLDFDLGLGWQRQNYNLTSFDYAAAMLASNARYGITDKLTLAANTTLSKAWSSAELGGVFQLANLPMTANLGLGHYQLENADNGSLARFGVNYRAGRWFAGAQGLYAEQPDSIENPLPLHLQWTARAGVNLARWRVSADSLYRKRDTQDRYRRHNLRLSRSFRLASGHWSISAGLFRTEDSQSSSDSGVLLNLNWSPDRRQSISVTSAPKQLISGRYAWQDTDAIGQQYGAEYLHQNQLELTAAQVQSRHNAWQWQGRVQNYNGDSSVQLGAQGAVGRVSGDTASHWFVSRQLGDSYALVDLQSIPNVPIYLHNRKVALSDARGLALLPNLRPYEDNQLSINPLDLPLDIQLEETTFQLKPALGMGLYLDIPMRGGHALQFRLMQDPLNPVPEGAVIRQPDHPQRFYVGRDGESYIDSLNQPETEFRAYWGDQQCAFIIHLKQAEQSALPHIGKVLCD